MTFLSKVVEKCARNKPYSWLLHIVIALLFVLSLGYISNHIKFVSKILGVIPEAFFSILPESLLTFHFLFFGLPLLTTVLVIIKYVKKRYSWFLHIAAAFVIIAAYTFIKHQFTKDQQEGLSSIAEPMIWMVLSVFAFVFYILSVFLDVYKQRKLSKKK